MGMECLDANVVQDLMSGALDTTGRSAVLAHLDTCDDCRELLAVTARDTARSGGGGGGGGGGVDPLEATAAPDIATTDTLAGATARPAHTGNIALDETAASLEIKPPPGALPSSGQRLGRYEIVERLGAGAMGVVFRARDTQLGREVALKLLRRPDPGLVERLHREAQSMAQVNHRNVVHVYDSGVTGDGATYIAMELVSGQSLRAWQSAEKHTIREIVEVYLAAGQGLGAAHAAGIIHRDFKPDNVLVGADGIVRVTDFGLAAAKATESGVVPKISDVNLTTSGSVLGTPAYMAPEQFVGGNVDPRTDQFNFCVALYEALYGERPFEGKTFQELGDNVCDGKLRPAPAGTQVSGGVRAILVRGLSVKPGDRFPTMGHLLTELGRDRARPWRLTSWVAAALAGVLGLGALSDLVVRDRVEAQIGQSFRLTGEQLRHTLDRMAWEFRALSEVAYREQALRQLSGHRDQADFGLGTPEADRVELESLHATLASTEWVRLRDAQLAIADYKGRVMYASAAPDVWGHTITNLAPIKRAIDTGEASSITVLPYAALGGKLGPMPANGLAVMFERTLSLGGAGDREARAMYIQVQDANDLLDALRLDKDARFALVSPDGTSAGDPELTAAIIAAAPENGDIAEVTDRDTYLVQSRDVPGFDGKDTIGRVVMARPISGVLTLFPGARTVFAVAALVAITLAFLTALRARQITGARV
jgi:predicted Ser/Thr protein kinase